MKAVRIIAGILFYVSRAMAILVLLVVLYASGLFLLHYLYPGTAIPLDVSEYYNTFQIYYPFTRKIFLLGDYSREYLLSYLITVLFYDLFLWLLADVFLAFRQVKLFTKKSVHRLSRFYLLNLLVPFLFLILFLVFKEAFSDVARIVLLHLVIGVFAFFMAAIFKQGQVLQEEQDLTF